MLLFWQKRSNLVILLIFHKAANLIGTAAGGQFGWGGTL